MAEKTTLPNGVRILVERVPAVRTVSVGIWVKAGSRYERAEINGVSHFIEHMLFKGTDSRTAGDLAVEMDEIGGQVNAFTTKDMTCFYIRTLDTCLKAAIDILCDMFFNSKFAEEDVAMERSVIMEEIDMYEDSPEDLSVESLISGVFGSSPLGWPVLGSKETVSALTSDDMRAYMSELYRAPSVVIALAGSIDEDCIEYIKSAFSKMPADPAGTFEPAGYSRSFTAKKKTIEQTHIALGFPSLPSGSEDIYALNMVNSILGGGMSSRLFQSVREKNGLCYAVYSFNAAHADAGLFSVYTACSDQTAEAAFGLICEEIYRFADKGATDDEIARCRRQIETGILMGLESTGSRMNFIARNELVYGRDISYDEIIKRYEAVSSEDILAVSRKILDLSSYSLSVVSKSAELDKMKIAVERLSAN